MVCAFGLEACKQRYKTKHVRLPDMPLELDMARTDGTYKKVLANYADPIPPVIDEWLLLKPIEAKQHDILELLYRRRKNPPRSSFPSTIPMVGMISLVVTTVLLLKPFLKYRPGRSCQLPFHEEDIRIGSGTERMTPAC